MRVRDEAVWQQQCAELEADEIGRDFRRFVEVWVEEAERYYDDQGGFWDATISDPAYALREALAVADEKMGRVSVHFLGQMLVVVATHWIHGDEMMANLTPIEMRLVQDMLALKVAELKQEAGQEEGVDESH